MTDPKACPMEYEERTAEKWEAFFHPHLIIHNLHGFGSSYYSGPNEDFYKKPITLKEFEQGLMSCSIMKHLSPEEMRKIIDQQSLNSRASNSSEGNGD